MGVLSLIFAEVHMYISMLIKKSEKQNIHIQHYKKMKTFTKALVLLLVAVSPASSVDTSLDSSISLSSSDFNSTSADTISDSDSSWSDSSSDSSSESSSDSDFGLDAVNEFIESSSCVGNPRPGGITRSGGSNNGNGSRFGFRLLNDGDEQCTDNRGQTYSFGTITNVRSFEDCANRCVQDSPLDLINKGVFRGIDFDCSRHQCNCLFDAREFNRIPQRELSRSAFRTTNQRGRGNDSVDRSRGRARRDFYCGTLVGFMDAELATSRRALRGSTN